jgi:uncharacterized membrane protein
VVKLRLPADMPQQSLDSICAAIGQQQEPLAQSRQQEAGGGGDGKKGGASTEGAGKAPNGFATFKE